MEGYLGTIRHPLSGPESLSDYSSDYSKSLSCNLARTARSHSTASWYSLSGPLSPSYHAPEDVVIHVHKLNKGDR